MSDFKLVYFDLRGRGEVIRLLFHAAGQAFEDVRLSPGEQWIQKHKAETPYGQVPYMVYKGKTYGQSIAIQVFLARKFGFYGKTDEDGLRIDEVTHLNDDFRPNIRAWRLAPDAEKKAEMVDRMKREVFPRYLGYFQNLLADNGSTGFFVGDSVSLADLVVYDMVDTVIAFASESAIAGFPGLQKLRQNVEKLPAISNYVKTRPNSQI